MTTSHEAIYPEDDIAANNPYEQRVQQIEDLIDPQHTLPQITLGRNPSLPDTKMSTYYLVYDGGENIGEARLITRTEFGEAWVRDPEIYERPPVEEQLLGKGYGTALYLALIKQAIRQGLNFRTEVTSQSKSAKKIWDRLFELGVAEEIEPFRPLPEPDQYWGYYVIKARE